MSVNPSMVFETELLRNPEPFQGRLASHHILALLLLGFFVVELCAFSTSFSRSFCFWLRLFLFFFFTVPSALRLFTFAMAFQKNELYQINWN